MNRLLAGLLALFLAAPAVAVAQPNLSNLPSNSVVGRLGIGSGPGQAIPFANLTGNLLSIISGDCTVSATGTITCANLRRKLPTGTTNFYADSSATGCGGGGCLDTNAGTTALTAKKTVLGALYGVLSGYDFTCNVTAQSTAKINLLSNEVNAGQPVHYGPHDYPGACAGASVTIDGGNFTYEYDSASDSPIDVFFGPAFMLQNITLANTAGPCVEEFEHGSIRFGAGVVFGTCAVGIQLASESVVTFQNNFTIATNTTVSTFATAKEGSFITFGAGITVNVSGHPTYSVAMFVADYAGINMNSVSWSGNTPSGSKYAIVDSGAIFNGAASIPASGAGTTAGGGTVDAGPVAVTAGGTGSTTTAAEQARLAMSTLTACAAAVNFNSGNADTPIPFTMPTGFTRIIPFRVSITNASHTLVTATFGVFSAAAAGGTALIAGGTAISVSGTTDASANNAQSISATTTTSFAASALPTANTVQFRVGTAEGAAATADVCMDYWVRP